MEIVKISPETIKSGRILHHFQLCQHSEKQPVEGTGMVAPGVYHWEWDGYINNKLDTKLLKDNILSNFQSLKGKQYVKHHNS